MISAHTLFYALLGGVLPAAIWLWFWLKEDIHPEPRWMIFLTFISGMIAVPLVLPFQYLAYNIFNPYPSATVFLFIVWAALEEIFKFTAAYVIVLKKKVVDEPIDPVIYMLTAALGFVALENTLYLVNPLNDGGVVQTVILGNLRFLGASLVHILSSATIGAFMALSFYRTKQAKHRYLVAGLILAIALHSAFNLSIIGKTSAGVMAIFAVVWTAAVVLLLVFEKIKTIIPKI